MKILLQYEQNTTMNYEKYYYSMPLSCNVEAQWYFLCSEITYTVLLARTPILDIAPIDLAIGGKLLQYLSLIYETNTTQSVEI